MANVQTSGIASLSIDGIFYDISGDLQYSTNSTSKEPLISQSGPSGYKTSFVYGLMSANFRDTNNVSTVFFEQLNNVTVTAQLANGKIIVGTNMFCEEIQTVNTEESTFEVKFRGTVAQV